MTNENTPQFDTYVGGFQAVPSGVNISEFVKNRMEEVVMLTETIKESPFKGQAFQRLPKHMRRRQMSHYIKRLPRRLQRPYLLSLKDGLPVPTKRPSRKFRRRPANLLLDYNRRQKDNIWLETHIWHAKRFHMIKKWGYKLPEKPTDKSFRACYRAVSEHCLLTDISYYNCIELIGPEIKLLDGLKQCTSTECGLTFSAKMFLNGSREGKVFLFNPNSYPRNIIGNVSFIWKPPNSGDKNRQIWIWVHPLMHTEAVDCFKTVFNLTSEKVSNGVNYSAKEEEQDPVKELKPMHKSKKQKRLKKIKQKTEEIKLEPKNVPFTHIQKYVNQDDNIVMFLLKDTLNRFRLTGPLSQAILSQNFEIPSVSPPIQKNLDLEIVEVQCKKRKIDIEVIEEVNEDKPEEKWWVEYYKNKFNKKNCEVQKEFYQKLCNYSKPTDLPSQMVLSVIIGDPRLSIPPKREKAVPNIQDLRQLPSNTIENGLCHSPIWDPVIRDKVSLSKLSTHEINEARSKKIVPGFDVKEVIPNEKQSRIPILLVQRPGRVESDSERLGLGSGWDIIAPAGFGMPIWISLIFRGARAGGLREHELMGLECNDLKNYLQPDSNAGETDNQAKLQELKKRYFSLAPNKRANFIKLGVLSPFYFPWKILINDWVAESGLDTTDSFYVLRNKKILQELNGVLEKFPKCQDVDFKKLLNFGVSCLIPVVINCTGKGNPANLGMICLPNVDDLKSGVAPQEPAHIDENESLRKILKSEHKKLLKSLRRKRRKDRLKLKEEFASNLPGKLKWKEILESNSAPSKPHSDEYNNKMKALWVPEVESIKGIINSTCRKILGFVVKGGFSFSISSGKAVGYVTLPGLVELLTLCKKQKSKVLVLIRNRNHVQYRFGKLRIIMD